MAIELGAQNGQHRRTNQHTHGIRTHHLAGLVAGQLQIGCHLITEAYHRVFSHAQREAAQGQQEQKKARMGVLKKRLHLGPVQ